MLLSIFLSATLNQSDHLLHALDVNSPTLPDFISYISEIFNVYFAKQSVFRDNPTSHTLLNKKEEYENKNLIYAKKMKNLHHLIMTVNLFIVYPSIVITTWSEHINYLSHMLSLSNYPFSLTPSSIKTAWYNLFTPYS